MARGCTSSNAITGVIATLGYLKEKKRFVEDPRIEKRIDRNHMRGVLTDRVVLSIGDTEARTCGYGELSGGSSSSPAASSSSSPSVLASSSSGIGPSRLSFGRAPSVTPKRPSRPPDTIDPPNSSDRRRGLRAATASYLAASDLRRRVTVWAGWPSATPPPSLRAEVTESWASAGDNTPPSGTAPYEGVRNSGDDRRKGGSLVMGAFAGPSASVWELSAAVVSEPSDGRARLSLGSDGLNASGVVSVGVGPRSLAKCGRGGRCRMRRGKDWRIWGSRASAGSESLLL